MSMKGSKDQEGTRTQRPARMVGLGIVIGLVFAVVYSVVASVIFLVAGDQPEELLAVVASYFGGGVVAGAIIGWLRPYSRTHVGSIVVGIIGAFPVFLGFAVADEGLPLNLGDLATVAAVAVTLGGILGHKFLYKEV